MHLQNLTNRAGAKSHPIVHANLVPATHTNTDTETLLHSNGHRHRHYHSEPSSHPRPHWLKWMYRWGQEAGTGIIAIAAFFGMMSMLLSFNGKGQPDWPYGITLNTAASLFSAIMKGMLLTTASACISQSVWVHYATKAGRLDLLATFDSASRGPWGSMQLLWALKAKQLACLGALLTILSIAIDPSIQQSIIIRTRMFESPAEASIPRALYYIDFTYLDYYTSITPGFMGALMSGILQGTTDNAARSWNVTPRCPTGNCTFPPFQSIALCTECADISHAASKTCATFSHAENGTSYTHCLFTTTAGLQINQTRVFNSDGYLKQKTIATRIEDKNGTVWKDNSLVNVALLHGFTQENGSMPITLTGCSLYWCINTYKSTVMNGSFTENVTNSMPFNFDNSDNDGDSIVLDTVTQMETSIAGSNVTNTFTIGDNASKLIRGFLSSKLNFSNSKQLNWDGDKSKAANKTLYLDDSVARIDYFNSINQDAVSAFLEVDDPATIFRNLAKSATTYMRTLNSPGILQDIYELDPSIIPNQTSVKGTAYQQQVYVAIRWPWLAFSASLLAVTLVFFVLVVIQSATTGVAIWKSSPLALLAHGLGPESQDKLRLETEIVDMEDRASKMDVKLLDKGVGRFLVEVNGMRGRDVRVGRGE